MTTGGSSLAATVRDFSRMMTGCGLAPRDVADAAFDGIAAQQLYIIPDSQFLETARARFETILGAFPTK